MVSDDKHVPLIENTATKSKQQFPFSFWLRREAHTLIPNSLPATQTEPPPPEKLEKTHMKIVLRRSIFTLIFAIISIEILFDALYILFRAVPFYTQFITIPAAQTAVIYFVLFVSITFLKLCFIMVFCLRWLTTTYEIANGEIKFKQGIFSDNEKVYLCRHTQEVIASRGFFGKIFNFGSIEIYDPSLKERIYIDSVQNPQKYAEIIKNNLPSAKPSELLPPLT